MAGGFFKILVILESQIWQSLVLFPNYVYVYGNFTITCLTTSDSAKNMFNVKYNLKNASKIVPLQDLF